MDKNKPSEDGNKNDSTILYRIHISSSYAQLDPNSPFFKGLENVDVYTSDELFKYVTGKDESYSNIKSYLDEVKIKFPDAFIIAIKNGKIISLQQAFQEFWCV